jgi:prepilin-type processing-associated H-X9-DG protein
MTIPIFALSLGLLLFDGRNLDGIRRSRRIINRGSIRVWVDGHVENDVSLIDEGCDQFVISLLFVIFSLYK